MIYWIVKRVGEEGHEGVELTPPLLGVLLGTESLDLQYDCERLPNNMWHEPAYPCHW